MSRRKKRRPNSEVSLAQLQNMGSRGYIKEPKEHFKREPGCITSCSEIPTYFDKTTYKKASQKRGPYKKRGDNDDE